MSVLLNSGETWLVVSGHNSPLAVFHDVLAMHLWRFLAGPCAKCWYID